MARTKKTIKPRSSKASLTGPHINVPVSCPPLPECVEIKKFESGAVRSNETASGSKVDYTLICPEALKSLAITMEEGASHYGKHNWTKGIPNSNSLNHALSHLQEYLAGDRKEDHLGHALANISFIIHFNKGCQCDGGFELLEATNK